MRVYCSELSDEDQVANIVLWESGDEDQMMRIR